ncbi:MAG: hypothetical protein AVDCRST_MAG59-2315 [uncultured Thermomicrobiales bacterium]|uniref:Uncharacterized protein n=1 Tax=uncultured Thermomicrobiales bacterium TaxID=1645740 RepID=A0A6J4UUK8_9BACT|nr:MAG: hypothetical protein AVDCRST_MAG59-2315 [uncultured Thermomicrobiales bacterium]
MANLNDKGARPRSRKGCGEGKLVREHGIPVPEARPGFDKRGWLLVLYWHDFCSPMT